jgi:hypothetical protein
MSAAATLIIAAQNHRGLNSEEESWDAGRDPELCFYRHRTVSLLRRYMRLSVEVGRLPSILGRELFRSKAASYRSVAFEDVVIFVHDIESALSKLDVFFQELIGRVVLQEYTHNEAAELLHCTRRTVGRYLPEALDQLSELLLRGGLMRALPGSEKTYQNACQEGETSKYVASSCCEAK